jgi:DNA processing protein
LIKQGATLIEVPSDVIRTLENLPAMQEDIFSDDFDYENFTPEAFSENELDNARKSVLSLLGNGAVAIDDLIRQSGATASLVSIVLVELELAGRIERLPGNNVNLLLEWQG